MCQVAALLAGILTVSCGGAQGPPSRSPTTTVVATVGEGGVTFSGGLAWSLTMRCGTAQTFTLESNGYILGGKWLIEWPRGCTNRHSIITIHLRPSWMHCDPVTGWSQQIIVGEEVRVPIICTEPLPEGS